MGRSFTDVHLIATDAFPLCTISEYNEEHSELKRQLKAVPGAAHVIFLAQIKALRAVNATRLRGQIKGRSFQELAAELDPQSAAYAPARLRGLDSWFSSLVRAAVLTLLHQYSVHSVQFSGRSDADRGVTVKRALWAQYCAHEALCMEYRRASSKDSGQHAGIFADSKVLATTKRLLVACVCNTDVMARSLPTQTNRSRGIRTKESSADLNEELAASLRAVAGAKDRLRAFFGDRQKGSPLYWCGVLGRLGVALGLADSHPVGWLYQMSLQSFAEADGSGYTVAEQLQKVTGAVCAPSEGHVTHGDFRSNYYSQISGDKDKANGFGSAHFPLRTFSGYLDAYVQMRAMETNAFDLLLVQIEKLHKAAAARMHEQISCVTYDQLVRDLGGIASGSGSPLFRLDSWFSSLVRTALLTVVYRCGLFWKQALARAQAVETDGDAKGKPTSWHRALKQQQEFAKYMLWVQCCMNEALCWEYERATQVDRKETETPGIFAVSGVLEDTKLLLVACAESLSRLRQLCTLSTKAEVAVRITRLSCRDGNCVINRQVHVSSDVTSAFVQSLRSRVDTIFAGGISSERGSQFSITDARLDAAYRLADVIRDPTHPASPLFLLRFLDDLFPRTQFGTRYEWAKYHTVGYLYKLLEPFAVKPAAPGAHRLYRHYRTEIEPDDNKLRSAGAWPGRQHAQSSNDQSKENTLRDFVIEVSCLTGCEPCHAMGVPLNWK